MKYDCVSERNGPETRIRMPQDLIQFLEKYATKKQEHFIAITLAGNHTIIRVRIVSIGLVNRTLVHPREVFIPAVKESAAAIILVHNHPTVDPAPSGEDIAITRRLREAGDIMGIKVLDHIIIGDGEFVSFVERGIL